MRSYTIISVFHFQDKLKTVILFACHYENYLESRGVSFCADNELDGRNKQHRANSQTEGDKALNNTQ